MIILTAETLEIRGSTSVGSFFMWGRMGLKDNQVFDAVNKALSHIFNILEHADNPEGLQNAVRELQKSSTVKRLTQVWVAFNDEDITDGN